MGSLKKKRRLKMNKHKRQALEGKSP